MKNFNLLRIGFPVKILVIAAFGIFVLITACQKNLYVPKATDATASATLEALTAGRTLFMDKCKKCHPLPSPDKIVTEKWVKIMDMMAPKAKLTATEKAAVLSYVTRGKL